MEALLKGRVTIQPTSSAICSFPISLANIFLTSLSQKLPRMDGDREEGYIADVSDKATFGFKYFKFKDCKKITIWTRGYSAGCYEVKTKWDGPVLGTIPVSFTNIWEKHSAEIEIPDGVSALYLTYKGSGKHHLKGFELL